MKISLKWLTLTLCLPEVFNLSALEGKEGASIHEKCWELGLIRYC